MPKSNEQLVKRKVLEAKRKELQGIATMLEKKYQQTIGQLALVDDILIGKLKGDRNGD